MKSQFHAYLTRTEEEFSTLWNTAIFSFDTSVLLDLYRYKKATSLSFVTLTQKLAERKQVWLPYQVGVEFFRNRVEVIKEQMPVYSRFEEYLTKLMNDFATQYPRHSHIPFDDYRTMFAKTIAEVNADLAKVKSDHIDTTDTNVDDILKILINIFDGTIGSRPDDDTQKKVLAQCKARAEKFQPPFTLDSKDAKKGGERQYGDAVIWLELLEYMQDKKRPFVFVTSEKKDDWWYVVKGQTIGPKYEMIDEALQATGNIYHLYSMTQFLEYGERHFKIAPNKLAIEDVQSVEDEKQVKQAVSQWLTAGAARLALQKVRTEINMLDHALLKAKEKLERDNNKDDWSVTIKGLRPHVRRTKTELDGVRAKILLAVESKPQSIAEFNLWTALLGESTALLNAMEPLGLELFRRAGLRW